MTDMHPVGPKIRRKGVRIPKGKLAPDMTPMVGLGFLLVAFFLMAADFAKPVVMQLTMPVKPKMDDIEPVAFVCGSAMTVILGKNHQVHYFLGLSGINERPDLFTTDFGAAGLRQVLLKSQQDEPHLVILIKPGPGAKYQDLVDVLDEMNITDQKKFAIVDLASQDQELLDAYCL